MIEFESQAELEDFIKQKNRVVALFYSSWCPFCRSFLPIFSKYARVSGSENFIKIQLDDDDNPMWETFSIEAVPSLVFFENGMIDRRLDCKLGIGLNETKFLKWLHE